LKESRLLLHPDTIKIGDSGYQGMDKLFSNVLLPIKKKKGKSLTKEEKKYDRDLAKQRIFIEPSIVVVKFLESSKRPIEVNIKIIVKHGQL
jgi:hypothetical protein